MYDCFKNIYTKDYKTAPTALPLAFFSFSCGINFGVCFLLAQSSALALYLALLLSLPTPLFSLKHTHTVYNMSSCDIISPLITPSCWRLDFSIWIWGHSFSSTMQWNILPWSREASADVRAHALHAPNPCLIAPFGTLNNTRQSSGAPPSTPKAVQITPGLSRAHVTWHPQAVALNYHFVDQESPGMTPSLPCPSSTIWESLSSRSYDTEKMSWTALYQLGINLTFCQGKQPEHCHPFLNVDLHDYYVNVLHHLLQMTVGVPINYLRSVG